MSLALLLFACGGGAPAVTVTAGLHPEASAPAPLAKSLEGDFQRPIQRCYEAALQGQPDLAGAVTLTVVGSHGILKQEAGGGAPDALLACATEPLGSARLQRKLGDGDNAVGFVLTVTFSPEG